MDVTSHRPSAAQGAVAGAVAAATALAVGELGSALAGLVVSPVLGVGGRFVDRFAASLKEVAVALFGTNDKAALVVGTLVVTVAIGAMTGVVARRHRWLPWLVFPVFGVVGALAQLSDPRISGPAPWVVAGVSAGLGAAALGVLLRAASPPPLPLGSHTGPAAEPAPGDRRRFLIGAGAMAIGAVAMAATGRAMARVDVVADAARRFHLRRPGRRRPVPDPTFTVPGLSPAVTPTRDFYRIDTALSSPQVDPSWWRLRVEGLVDRPFELTFDELLALPSVEEPVTLQCVSNEIGGGLVGTAVWQGVPLADLLDRAGVRPDAEQVFTRSVDGWTAGFPLAAAGDGRVALVAYAMNGELLPVAHGFPARLVVSGLYGYVSATKWVESIELTRWDGVDGYWVPRGWSKDGPVKLASRIDVPRSGATVAAGPVTVAGVAWLPAVGVDTVEVAVDDGPWRLAELGPVASEHTWVQWRRRVELRAGAHRIRVRATDATGRVQTADHAEPAPDGATGHHQVHVTAAAP